MGIPRTSKLQGDRVPIEGDQLPEICRVLQHVMVVDAAAANVFPGAVVCLVDCYAHFSDLIEVETIVLVRPHAIMMLAHLGVLMELSDLL